MSLLNHPQPSGKLARWSLTIQDMDLVIMYRSGRSNTNADALSHNPVSIASHAFKNSCRVNCADEEGIKTCDGIQSSCNGVIAEGHTANVAPSTLVEEPTEKICEPIPQSKKSAQSIPQSSDTVIRCTVDAAGSQSSCKDVDATPNDSTMYDCFRKASYEISRLQMEDVNLLPY